MHSLSSLGQTVDCTTTKNLVSAGDHVLVFHKFSSDLICRFESHCMCVVYI